MISPTIQAALVFVGTWFTWRLLKRFVVKDPLSVIPGPTADSWWAGESSSGFADRLQIDIVFRKYNEATG
jgi:hypothetical protein